MPVLNKKELENCCSFCNFAYTYGLMWACFTVTAVFKTTAFVKAEENKLKLRHNFFIALTEQKLVSNLFVQCIDC